MAGKHRKRNRHAAKFTAIGVATATATALTVGIPPDPNERDARKAALADVDLAAAINPWPGPDQIPDLTGGLGTLGYDTSQAIADLVIRAIVENVNLAAIAQAAGLDLDTLLEGLLGGDLNDLLGGVLGGVLDEIPLDTGGLADALLGLLPLDPVTQGVLQPLLAAALGVVGADSVGGLLGLVGLDLSDPLNLANLVDTVPGVNIITAGPVFTLLKLLGTDIGWVPSLPNSVANDINDTEYLEVGLQGLLQTVLDIAGGGLLGDILQPIVDNLPPIEIIDLRVPVTIGIGLGAFAAATGYDKVLADLPNQPGGALSADNPLLGSLTVLPLVLLLNPARPNGGALARFYPLFGLFGIDTVNPETEATSSCGGPLCIPVLNTGLTLGGANLLPVLVDVGLGYFPANDLAAWPNPFSLANNLMALALPTYLLRGLDLSTVDEQVTTQVDDILADVLAGNPLAINLYLTLMPETLPLIEPLYLAADLLNLATLGAAPINPFSLVANAFAPVLTSLVNLGYTDVEFDPVTGGYVRTLTEAGVPTPFLSFPNVNLGQVPGVLINQLLQGIQKEFLSGNPTPGTPNAITGLLDLLGGGLGGVLPLGGLTDVIDNILNGLNPLALTQEATTLAQANSVPAAESRIVTLSTETVEDESASATASLDAAPPTEEALGEEESAEGEVSEEDADEDAADEDAADDEGADDEGADDGGADDEGADNEGADDEGADDEGADDEGADDEGADDKDADDKDADDKDAGGDDAAKPGSPNKFTPKSQSPSDGPDGGSDPDSDDDASTESDSDTGDSDSDSDGAAA